MDQINQAIEIATTNIKMQQTITMWSGESIEQCQSKTIKKGEQLNTV